MFVIASEPALALRQSRTERGVEIDALESPEGARVLSLRWVAGSGGHRSSGPATFGPQLAVDTPALPKPANLTIGA